jgi:hypothetical protein
VCSSTQAFPGTFTAEEADPFLMMDHFGPMRSTGKIQDPDAFQVDWHPHRGLQSLFFENILHNLSAAFDGCSSVHDLFLPLDYVP